MRVSTANPYVNGNLVFVVQKDDPLVILDNILEADDEEDWAIQACYDGITPEEAMIANQDYQKQGSPLHYEPTARGGYYLMSSDGRVLTRTIQGICFLFSRPPFKYVVG